MRTALEEISFRLNNIETNVGKRPADNLTDYDKGFFYQTESWNNYSIYILKTTLGIDVGLQQTLESAIKMSEMAVDC